MEKTTCNVTSWGATYGHSSPVLALILHRHSWTWQFLLPGHTINPNKHQDAARCGFILPTELSPGQLSHGWVTTQT